MTDYNLCFEDWIGSLENYICFISICIRKHGGAYSYIDVNISDFSINNPSEMVHVYCWLHGGLHINIYDHIHFGCPHCHRLKRLKIYWFVE